MPSSLSPDHPNLVLAASRLRRIILAWAILFLGVAALTLLATQNTIPMQWFSVAVLLLLSAALSPTAGAIGLQPALLALVATTWGLSLLGLIPELNAVFALDPIVLLFEAGTVERLALAFVRGILVVMAWNQFLFYRMLYGTRDTFGLEPGVPDIPEVVPNRTALLEAYARWAGIAGGLLVLVAFVIPTSGLIRHLLSSALGAGTLAMGLSLGVAFSPTRSRGAALISLIFGGLVFLVSIISARLLGP